jgi:UDP-glucose 4-epimerase
VTRDVLVTGGAGFIGSLVVDRLLSDGATVTIFDDLSGATPERAADLRADGGGHAGLRFIHGDVADLDAVVSAMAGSNEVIHLAANTDIAGGFADPRLDRDACILGTWNVAEAMRRHGIRRVAYASSGVVYGRPDTIPTAESSGPLRPASHYAAGKLAGEAILSGFAHLYGWRAQAFRFGNTVGAGSDHGVVHDFVVKLLRDPTRLEILGDGRQAKPYIAGDDVANAVLYAMDHGPDAPFDVYNVATQGTLTVLEVADLAVRALGLDPHAVEIRTTASSSGGGGWPGDTPVVDFDTTRLRATGWRPAFDARAAVERAAIGTRDRLDRLGAPLLTAMERRAVMTPIAVR